MNAPSRVVLVGASWGGQLIANYLAEHSERVDRAVVSSPNAVWAPAFEPADRLTDGGSADQVAAIGGNTQVHHPARPIRGSLALVPPLCLRSSDIRLGSIPKGRYLTKSHNEISRRSRHSRATRPLRRAVSPGQRVLTACFATRRPRVQILPAPLNTLVRAFSANSKARKLHDHVA